MSPNFKTMLAGNIIDPRFNSSEKDFGILVERNTGHHYLYIKDQCSQYLPQGTQVEFRLTVRNIDFETTHGSLQGTKIDFAVITDYDLGILPQFGHPKSMLKFIAETIKARKDRRKNFRLKLPAECQN
jgi:hypothetical protein